MFHRIAFILVFLVFSAALHAAPPKEALLIANGKYSHFAGLEHPAPDAAKLIAALEQLGFRVRLVRDGNREQMLDAISEFERGLRNTGAIAFFHYGGHGVQVDGKNYLLPADADIPDERRVATRAVALDEVMTAMDAAAARASIIVIDACRDNPLPAGSGRNLARGLSVVGMKPKNSIVIYAAEAGSKALDGLFTPILAVALQQKGRTIDQVMKSVRSEVYAKSSGQQTPGEYNQLFEELFLGETAGGDLSAEKVFAAKPAATAYAAPAPAPLAKDDMVPVEGGTLPRDSKLAGKSVKAFYIGRTEVTWLEWKKVRDWSTDNGYDIGNVGGGSGDDHPVRDVNWYDCLKWCNARSEMAGLMPVYLIRGDIYKRGEFAVVDQVEEADGYRLPSELEWEWAARGGGQSLRYKFSGSFDLKSVAWFKDNSKGADVDLASEKQNLYPDHFKFWEPKTKSAFAGRGTFSVGQKSKNELDLRDMSGNVWEWCWDLPTSHRRIRGGSWFDHEDYCAVAWQAAANPDNRYANVGFRLAGNLRVTEDETSMSQLSGAKVAVTPNSNSSPTPIANAKDSMVLVNGSNLPAVSGLARKSFYIGRTEVTWLEWKKVRDWAAQHGYDIRNAGKSQSDNEPVINLNWYECVKWCNAKSEMDGLEPVYKVNGIVYRNSKIVYHGDSEYCFDEVTQEDEASGYRLPNKMELFIPDLFISLSGCWEWCWNRSELGRAMRKGSSFYWINPNHRAAYYGLRLARNL